MEPLTLFGRSLHHIDRRELVGDVQQDLTPIDAEQSVDDIQIFKTDLTPFQQLDIDWIKLRRCHPVKLDRSIAEPLYLTPQLGKINPDFHQASR
ncbi:hypothetical protein D3C84_783780 [compost metagenome]